MGADGKTEIETEYVTATAECDTNTVMPVGNLVVSDAQSPSGNLIIIGSSEVNKIGLTGLQPGDSEIRVVGNKLYAAGYTAEETKQAVNQVNNWLKANAHAGKWDESCTSGYSTSSICTGFFYDRHMRPKELTIILGDNAPTSDYIAAANLAATIGNLAYASETTAVESDPVVCTTQMYDGSTISEETDVTATAECDSHVIWSLCYENYETCPQDCIKPIVCGDGTCEGGETCETCEVDCGACPPVCGDEICEGDETYNNCPEDCEAPKRLNGEACSSNSDCENNRCVHNICRPTDPYCGDGYCDNGESYSLCPSDCKKPDGSSCSLNSECLGGYCTHTICRSSSTYCGDGYCDTGENYSSCSEDCEAPKGITPKVNTEKESSTITKPKIEGNGYGWFLIFGFIFFLLMFLVLVYFVMKRRSRKVKKDVGVYTQESSTNTVEFKPKEAQTSFRSDKIIFKNVKKSYRKTLILKSVSVEFEKGKVYGIVGPSGCGKTRLVECIIGRITPDFGKISVFGYDSEKDKQKVNKIIGFVPQHPELYTEQSVWKNMQNSAIKWELSSDEFNERAENILKDVGLIARKNVSAKNLSGGQVKRLSLAMELLRNPEVLLLDEPTTGLDPGIRTRMMTILENINRRGKTIIFTTHYMDETDICDEVLIMKDGNLIVKDSVDGLRKKTPGRGRMVEITLERVEKKLINELEKDSKIEKVIESGRVLRMFIHEPNITEVTNKITNLGGVIEGSRIVQADMGDLFIYFTGEQPED